MKKSRQIKPRQHTVVQLIATLAMTLVAVVIIWATWDYLYYSFSIFSFVVGIAGIIFLLLPTPRPWLFKPIAIVMGILGFWYSYVFFRMEYVPSDLTMVPGVAIKNSYMDIVSQTVIFVGGSIFTACALVYAFVSTKAKRLWEKLFILTLAAFLLIAVVVSFIFASEVVSDLRSGPFITFGKAVDKKRVRECSGGMAGGCWWNYFIVFTGSNGIRSEFEVGKSLYTIVPLFRDMQLKIYPKTNRLQEIKLLY